jgi:BirA family biotin operon repressor/biotin-[acetyl-CoA-carboxylase] ligase
MWRIRQYHEVPSTNSLAREELLEGNARHGDVFIADHQTAGRGRLSNRAWIDEPGNALLMSIVLEQLPIRRVELLQYLTALVVANALRSIFQDHDLDRSRIHIKWPNDILLDGLKVCGILSEAIWQAQGLRAVVIGIGVNVYEQSVPASVEHLATSLAGSGARTDVETVRDRILRNLEHELGTLGVLPPHEVQQHILNRFEGELGWMKSLHGLEFTVSEQTVHHDMKFVGVHENGALMLRHSNGQTECFYSGSIRWQTHIA